MEALNPRQRGTLIEALGSAVFHGGTAIGDVPALLKRVLQTSAWREFETPAHQVVTYDRFESFVTTPPTRGLGASVDLIRRIVADDLEALDLLDQALQKPPHVHATDRVIHPISGDSKPSPQNRSTKILRRLRKDFPEQHAQVLRGEKSVTRAAVEAGIIERRVPLPVENIEHLAQALKRHLTAEQLAVLRDAL